MKSSHFGVVTHHNCPLEKVRTQKKIILLHLCKPRMGFALLVNVICNSFETTGEVTSSSLSIRMPAHLMPELGLGTGDLCGKRWAGSKRSHLKTVCCRRICVQLLDFAYLLLQWTIQNRAIIVIDWVQWQQELRQWVLWLCFRVRVKSRDS